MELLRVLGQGFHQGQLLGLGEDAGIHLLRGAHRRAALRHTGQEGADAGVGVLDIVHRVFAVLTDGQVQVEVQGTGGGPVVEIVPGGVHADLVQQVVEGDGLARPLGHAHRLAVLEEIHQLHEHNH